MYDLREKNRVMLLLITKNVALALAFVGFDFRYQS